MNPLNHFGIKTQFIRGDTKSYNDVSKPTSPKPRKRGGTDEEWDKYHKDWDEWEKQEKKAGRMMDAYTGGHI